MSAPDSKILDASLMKRAVSRRDYDGKSPKKDAVTYVYEFPARGNKPPVKVYWYEGGHLPKLPASLQEPESKRFEVGGGCLLVGDKNTIHSPGMRPTSPRLLNGWAELRKQLPAKTFPRAVGNPVKEIMAAVRGDIPNCGSNFDYAVPLTETVLLGTIAARSGKKVEYDPSTMSFKDPSLNKYVTEPVRKGWEYGTDLLKS